MTFAPVKADINGNVQKVMKCFEDNGFKMVYLQELIDIETEERCGRLSRATEGLLWLKR